MRLRMLDAARQQLLTGYALADVAVNTGFADQAHMTHHFSQTLGMPPARWLRIGAA
ncbi:MAG: helix-turn-helix domain-containing protein [Comamonas sp.]